MPPVSVNSILTSIDRATSASRRHLAGLINTHLRPSTDTNNSFGVLGSPGGEALALGSTSPMVDDLLVAHVRPSQEPVSTSQGKKARIGPSPDPEHSEDEDARADFPALVKVALAQAVHQLLLHCILWYRLLFAPAYQSIHKPY